MKHVSSAMTRERSDPRLIGYLNRALTHELAATRQYLAQARLMRLWGQADEADHFRAEADEELGHADRLMERLLAHSIVPQPDAGDPIRLGRDLREILEINRTLEEAAVRLYEDAAAYAARVSSPADTRLFDTLRGEEQKHLDEILTALASMR